MNTYDLKFEDVRGERSYRFRPGQFNMLYVPGVGEIAISVSGDPARRETIPHTIRESGLVTRALSQLSEGAIIGLRGPFGSEWPIAECRGRDVLLVAGGIGLAPLRPVVCELLSRRQDYGNLSLLIGTRESSALLYTSEYDQWRDQGLDVMVTVDRDDGGWRGNIGMVTALLNRMSLPQPQNTLMMTCGPEVMMWYTVQSAIERGLKTESLYVSLERNMNCAIGLCGHCQFGPQFICRDGPIFPYNTVASILKVEDL